VAERKRAAARKGYREREASGELMASERVRGSGGGREGERNAEPAIPRLGLRLGKQWWGRVEERRRANAT
jgi:hypothetical protein